MLVGFNSVSLCYESEGGDSLRATCTIVVKDNRVLDRSNGGMEQFLRTNKHEAKRMSKSRTNLDLEFVHILREVGYDDLFRSLGRRGSDFTSPRGGGGIPGTSRGGGNLLSKGFCACNSTTATGFSRCLWTRGDNLREKP